MNSICFLALCLTTSLMEGNGTQQEQLGAARSAFGDITLKSIPPKGESLYSWRFRSGLEEQQTEIYFPSGRSDERFFVNYVGGKKDRWVLQLEKSKNGVVSLEWSVPLEFHVPTPVYIPSFIPDEGGSMLRMLGRRGFYLTANPSPEIRKRLSVVEGYAGYWKGMPISSQLWYWYCDPDGQPSKVFSLEFTDAVVGTGRNEKHLPSMFAPFPITPFEAAAIKSAGPNIN